MLVSLVLLALARRLDKGRPVRGICARSEMVIPQQNKHRRSSFPTARNGLFISVEMPFLLPEAIVFQRERELWPAFDPPGCSVLILLPVNTA
jgi:hypothetical protein